MQSRMSLPIAVLAALLMLFGCHRKIDPRDLAPGITNGATYYTQFSLFQEKGKFRTTNFRRGGLLPVNTAVTLLSIDKKRIVVRVNDSAQPLTIENARKHTNEDVKAAFKKILGERKVDLSRFTPYEREGIREGNAKVGMSRRAVEVAMGYPPPKSTLTLNSDEWMYWVSRNNRIVVRFKDDKVAEIRN